MVEFILRLGSDEANLLDIAIVIFSIGNLLQWCFFIMLIVLKLHNKKENAPKTNKNHSLKHQGKRR